MKTNISWGPGKVSCLAWQRATQAGADMRTFPTMCGADGTSTSHALPPGLPAPLPIQPGALRCARSAPPLADTEPILSTPILR